jgi:hypothetical protein
MTSLTPYSWVLSSWRSWLKLYALVLKDPSNINTTAARDFYPGAAAMT